MSGPKCTEWSVTDNLRVQELARAAAWREADLMETALVEARRQLERASTAVRVRVNSTGVPDAVRPGPNAAISEIEAYLTSLREAHRQVKSRTERLAATSQLAEALSRAAASQTDRAVSTSSVENETLTVELNRRTEDVSRILSRLPELMARGDEAKLRVKAEEVLSASNAKIAQSLMLELRVIAQTAQERAAAVTRDSRLAQELVAGLRGLSGSAVDKVVLELEQVVNECRTLSHSLKKHAEEVTQSARAEADREYAAHVLREEFEALGYVVGEDFQTAIVQGGSLLVSRADRSPYCVRLHVEPGSTALESELVRQGDDADLAAVERQRRDLAAEEKWCSDLATVLTKAKRHRVVARVTRRLAPGVQPVQVVGSHTSRSEVRSRKGSQPRSRTD